MLQSFFPHGIAHYVAGGLLIGTGVALIFVLTGAVSGMSTVFSSTWSFLSDRPFFRQSHFTGSRVWRLVLATGLVLGAFLWWLVFGPPDGVQTQVSAWQLLVGGFVAGFGARMSNGCTSGHGICGLASLQIPSLLAVVTFLVTAIVVAHGVLALGGR